jgi:hypothetical protein
MKYDIGPDEMDILKPLEELKLTDLEERPVPIMFLSKYNYLDRLQENVSLGKLLEIINKINLDRLFSDRVVPDNDIILFARKYAELSTELNYNFDHDWDYLGDEMNLNSTNKLVL